MLTMIGNFYQELNSNFNTLQKNNNIHPEFKQDFDFYNNIITYYNNANDFAKMSQDMSLYDYSSEELKALLATYAPYEISAVTYLKLLIELKKEIPDTAIVQDGINIASLQKSLYVYQKYQALRSALPPDSSLLAKPWSYIVETIVPFLNLNLTEYQEDEIRDISKASMNPFLLILFIHEVYLDGVECLFEDREIYRMSYRPPVIVDKEPTIEADGVDFLSKKLLYLWNKSQPKDNLPNIRRFLDTSEKYILHENLEIFMLFVPYMPELYSHDSYKIKNDINIFLKMMSAIEREYISNLTSRELFILKQRMFHLKHEQNGIFGLFYGPILDHTISFTDYIDSYYAKNFAGRAGHPESLDEYNVEYHAPDIDMSNGIETIIETKLPESSIKKLRLSSS
jgi:hypothetical protein